MGANHDSQICGEGFWSVNARVGINKCLLGMVFTNHQLVMKKYEEISLTRISVTCFSKRIYLFSK